MPPVNADPDKLRQLAKALTSSAQQLEDMVRQVRRSLESTGWSGTERQRFEQGLGRTLKSVTQIAGQLKTEYVQELTKKAESLDRFRS